MKIAVIGCGRMGAQSSTRLVGQIPSGWLPISHVESVLEVDDVKLIGLCEIDEEQLKKAGDYYQMNSLFTCYKNMIDVLQPDIITIATRTAAKKDIIKYACQHGVKGIYVEKPLTNSINNFSECAEVVKKYNVKLGYGVNRRYHAIYRQAKKLVSEGMIGDLQQITLEHGTSQLLWSHPHTMDLILFFASSTELTGLQAHLSADSVSHTSKWQVDSDPKIESAFFKFASGITAQITRGGGFNVRLGGSTGNLTIHADGAYIEINQSSEKQPSYFLQQKIIHSLVNKGATVTAISELSHAIKNDMSLSISLEEIEANTRMLMGCVWSHLQNNEFIKFQHIPEQLEVTGKYNNLYP